MSRARLYQRCNHFLAATTIFEVEEDTRGNHSNELQKSSRRHVTILIFGATFWEQMMPFRCLNCASGCSLGFLWNQYPISIIWLIQLKNIWSWQNTTKNICSLANLTMKKNKVTCENEHEGKTRTKSLKDWQTWTTWWYVRHFSIFL